MRTWMVGLLGLGVLAAGWYWLQRSTTDPAAPISNAIGSPLSEVALDVCPDNDGLVQVLIYGLAVFDFQEKGSARALFPPAKHHEVTLSYGKIDTLGPDTYDWKLVKKDAGGHDLFLKDGTIEVLPAMKSGFSVLSSSLPMNLVPDSQDSAKSVLWIFPAKKMEGISNFNPGSESAKLVMNSGTLETCGLVHSPKNFHNICKIMSNYSDESRAASEYMVLRFVVPKGMTYATISTKKGKDLLQVDVPYTRLDTLIEDKCYSRVFDIRVANLGPLENRDTRTGHVAALKPYFGGAIGKWEVMVPNCELRDLDWNCRGNCSLAMQPPCLEYFVKNYPSAFHLPVIAGGANRPMCPFVQYP